ncbi:PPOX class F420-dependent oxidoreductase [Streptomyces triticirhizae]|uniref:PPOX class F420-dependent oxidoreductase n=1 Tax=Streptomyces triticirhizae TaxID=2483353 RepID=A0A3M2M228_9ACTN|nr:PPOX class F420-dependent oxidoreductase [Streptomyces triticirhizae]RMI42525.1 PPOX class F420-dependent oxidoreductase [Streptomyces triticirhizae]
MAHVMGRDEWRAFLAEGTRTGKLSTTRADGTPHVAPVWFVLDGEDVVLTTGRDTVKGHNLARDGRVAFCVDDQAPPFAFVVLQGRAELSEDAGELKDWATRIAARYMGQERAAEFGERNAAPGEMVVRVRPEHVVAQADLTA